MYKIRLWTTALLVALCTGFYSCSSDDLDKKESVITPEIAIETGTNINFTSSAGEQTLSFSTNTDWSIAIANTANGESWCSVTSISGKAGSNNIKIKVTENTGYDDRNVSLTIQVGSVTKTIIVTQKQKDALTLTTDKFEVGKTGGTINVEVKSNIQYEVVIPETSKSWIKQSVKTRGLTSKNLTFDIAASEEYEKREGEIIFQSGELTEKIHVYQAGEGILLLTKNEFPVSDKGETIAVEIKSNFDFDIQMPNVDWIQSAAKTRGMSSHTLYYTVKSNETYDSREAEIIFFDKNNSIRDTLKVIQAQKDAILISQDEYNVLTKGEIIEVELNANIKYKVNISPEFNWITPINKTRGLTNNKLSFNISRNETTNERIGYITILSTGQNANIKITQPQFDSELTINIINEGTLSSLIEDWQMNLITKLTLVGNLNGLDLKTIREMAGITSEGVTTNGNLIILDLKDANIKKDRESGHYYYRERYRLYHGVSYIDFDKTYYVLEDNQIGNYFFKDTKLTSIVLPSNIRKIEDGGIIVNTWIPERYYYFKPSAFGSCKITSITFPESLIYIGKSTFDSISYLQEIHCKSKTPPSIHEFAFSTYSPITNCVLYIPKGCLSTYKSASVWSSFTQIIEE